MFSYLKSTYPCFHSTYLLWCVLTYLMPKLGISFNLQTLLTRKYFPTFLTRSVLKYDTSFPNHFENFSNFPNATQSILKLHNLNSDYNENFEDNWISVSRIQGLLCFILFLGVDTFHRKESGYPQRDFSSHPRQQEPE